MRIGQTASLNTPEYRDGGSDAGKDGWEERRTHGLSGIVETEEEELGT